MGSEKLVSQKTKQIKISLRILLKISRAMSLLRRCPNMLKEAVNVHHQLTRRISMSSISNERFGTSEGGSGRTWDKGGIGMGGKDAGLATQIKPDVGKGKAYQVPEFFAYNSYSYFDVEKEMVAQRVAQPSSGLSEYWGDAEKGKS